jgi:precorrin-2 dehydrogenase / sirohydrochlorin ferrochelatase
MSRAAFCVVVGCGRVAKRKVIKLLEHGACIRLVVPASEPIAGEDWPLSRLEAVVTDKCQGNDLAGARLVVAATNNTEVNRRVAQMARAMGILVLQVNAPDESDFHLPAILKAGDLTVAFSTNGASPPFAARLRDEAHAYSKKS